MAKQIVRSTVRARFGTKMRLARRKNKNRLNSQGCCRKLISAAPPKICTQMKIALQKAKQEKRGKKELFWGFYLEYRILQNSALLQNSAHGDIKVVRSALFPLVVQALEASKWWNFYSIASWKLAIQLDSPKPNECTFGTHNPQNFIFLVLFHFF